MKIKTKDMTSNEVGNKRIGVEYLELLNVQFHPFIYVKNLTYLRRPDS